MALTAGRFLLRESRNSLFRALAWMALVALTEGVGLLLLIPVLAIAGMPPSSTVERAVAGLVMSGGDPALSLVPLLLVGVLVLVLRARWMRAASAASVTLQLEVGGRFRSRLHRALLTMEWPLFLRERRDAWQHLLMARIDDVQDSVEQVTRVAFDGSVSLVMLVLALVTAPWITLVVLLGVAVALLVRASASGRARRAGHDVVVAGDALAAESGAQLAGLRMIRAAGAEHHALKRFERAVKRYHGAVAAAADLAVQDRAVWAIASSAVLALGLWVAIGPGQLTPATLLVSLAIWSRLLPRALGIRASLRDLSESAPAWEAVEAAIRLGGPSGDSGWAAGEQFLDRTTVARESAERAPAVREGVRCEALSFRWTSDGPFALNDLSATIPAHGLTVVTGPSGAGKSTLCDLLLGLVEPTSGRIVVDGDVLDAEARARWRRSVGYLAQEPIVLAGTVSENLRWTHPDASDAQLKEAIALAAADFVWRGPLGLDAPVGDKGSLLSGGERQRLALARALIGAPVLLILDEATSALDEATEARILETLLSLRERTTIVMISHRAAARAAADVVIEL